jgi:geranylgeranyl pyrophosphate synthase
MTYFLIQDDLADIKDDLRKKEENVLIDAGLDDAGLLLITEMIDQSHDALLSINPILSNRIDYKRKMMDLKEIIELHAEIQQKRRLKESLT